MGNYYWLSPELFFKNYFQHIWIFMQIIQILSYLLISFWLFKINQKLWEKNAWISFIPLIQIYSLVKASWKPLIWILWIILLPFLSFLVIGFTIFIIISSMFSSWGFSNYIWIALWVSFILIIVSIWFQILILNGISKRTWNWWWTTALMFFFPYIMFPYIWITMLDWWKQINNSNSSREVNEFIDL